MALRDFTDEEMEILARIVRREKQKIVNVPSRPSQDRSFDENQDWLAPEHYIAAIVDEDGIPALTPASETGTGNQYDTPGSALCDIYRIVDGQLIQAGFQKTVYNISTRVITSDWFTVSRDKYGKWVASPPPGVSDQIIFRPTGVAPGQGFSCDAVLAEVIIPPCSGNVQRGDEVIVLDPSLRFDNPYASTGFFHMPQDLLFRSGGVAVWMATHESEYERPEGIGECRWVVTNMYCVEPSEY